MINEEILGGNEEEFIDFNVRCYEYSNALA